MSPICFAADVSRLHLAFLAASRPLGIWCGLLVGIHAAAQWSILALRCWLPLSSTCAQYDDGSGPLSRISIPSARISAAMPSGTNFSLFMLLACGRGASRPPEFIFCSTLVGITLVHSLTGTPWRCLRNCWRIPLRGTCCFRPYYDFLLHFVCQICAWFFLESSARRGAAFSAAAAGLWKYILWMSFSVVLILGFI